MWIALLVIAIAGAVGGLVNAFLSDNGGIAMPTALTVDGRKIYRPGFVVNIVIGAVAAVISWGLYGPLSGHSILETAEVPITIASLAGALLVGVGGARWISNEADKNLLKAATAKALDAAGASVQANRASQDTPLQALQIAEEVAREKGDQRNTPPELPPTDEAVRQPTVRVDS